MNCPGRQFSNDDVDKIILHSFDTTPQISAAKIIIARGLANLVKPRFPSFFLRK
jgi:hypothetical protein